MSFDVAVDSRLHAALRARDVLAEIERERVEAIALALADAEQAAVERLDELRTIRRAHDLLLVERAELRSERDAYRTRLDGVADELTAAHAALAEARADADRARTRAATAEHEIRVGVAKARKAKGSP